MEAIQNVVASATHRNIWTRLGELHWPGRNYLRLAARFPAASRKNGTVGGVWVPAVPAATDGAYRPNGATEGAGSRGPIVQDSGSNLPTSARVEVANLTPSEAPMQAAVLFHSFRRAIRTWSDITTRLDEPAAQLSPEVNRQLSEAHEFAYEEWSTSLDRLLISADCSKPVVQMKVDAFCEFAMHHLCGPGPLVVYAILLIHELTRVSELNPANVDRLSAACRGLAEVAMSAGIVMS